MWIIWRNKLKIAVIAQLQPNWPTKLELLPTKLWLTNLNGTATNESGTANQYLRKQLSVPSVCVSVCPSPSEQFTRNVADTKLYFLLSPSFFLTNDTNSQILCYTKYYSIFFVLIIKKYHFTFFAILRLKVSWPGSGNLRPNKFSWQKFCPNLSVESTQIFY